MNWTTFARALPFHTTYNASGLMVAEYSTTPPQSPTTSYLTNDNLGTPRINTNASGQVTARHDYLPFGEEINTQLGQQAMGQRFNHPHYVADSVRQKFTQYEKDTETDLDYAQARYYSNRQGRFTTVDPTLLSVNGYNPQTWNRYVYVMNNPLAYTDPLGLWAIDVVYSYKIKGFDQNGSPIYETDKKGNRIVTGATVVAYKTKDDDGASLAKQLGLTGNAAKEFAGIVGDQTSVDLSAVGDIGKVSEDIKYVAEVFDAVGEGLKQQAESIRKSGRSPDSANCGGTSCRIGLRNFFLGSFIDPDDFDPVLNREAKPVSESEARIGDIVRYATDKGRTPQHYANFIFRDDSGVPLVFSKSGTDGPYEIRTAKSLEGRQAKGVNYGNISGYHRRR